MATGEPRCPHCGYSLGMGVGSAIPIVARPPALCPVCVGRGTVPGGFYAALGVGSSTAREQCMACKGRGVL